MRNTFKKKQGQLPMPRKLNGGIEFIVKLNVKWNLHRGI